MPWMAWIVVPHEVVTKRLHDRDGFCVSLRDGDELLLDLSLVLPPCHNCAAIGPSSLPRLARGAGAVRDPKTIPCPDYVAAHSRSCASGALDEAMAMPCGEPRRVAAQAGARPVCDTVGRWTGTRWCN